MAQKAKTLAEYFAHHPKRNQAWLAQELGISAAYVSMIVSGVRQPRLGMALRIEALTGVPLESLVSEAKAS